MAAYNNLSHDLKEELSQLEKKTHDDVFVIISNKANSVSNFKTWYDTVCHKIDGEFSRFGKKLRQDSPASPLCEAINDLASYYKLMANMISVNTQTRLKDISVYREKLTPACESVMQTPTLIESLNLMGYAIHRAQSRLLV